MNSAKDKKVFGSIEAATEIWLFLKEQVELLDRAKKIVLKQKSIEPWTTIHPLIFAVIDSSKSILTLAQDWKLRDCYAIGRSIYETIINICFICAKGPEAAARMKQHATHKIYRDHQEREIKIGQTALKARWSGTIELEKNEALKLAVENFTRNNKKEITQWTPESVTKRLAVINAKYGDKITTNLQFAQLSIYRHASEIIHGTYFGALFAVGYTSIDGPPQTKEELNTYQQKQISLLLMMIGAAIIALLEVLAKEMNLHEIIVESKRATDKLRQLLTWDSINENQQGFSIRLNDNSRRK